MKALRPSYLELDPRNPYEKRRKRYDNISLCIFPQEKDTYCQLHELSPTKG